MKTVYILGIVFLLCASLINGYADNKTLIPQIYFHTISDAADNPYNVNTSNFQNMMNLLKELDYCTITFNDFYKFRNNTIQLCDRPVIIVFDDGSMSQYTNAYPILKANSQVGVIAEVTERGDWNDGEWINWSQLRNLNSNGWEIISHTVNHSDLTTLTSSALTKQLNDSKIKIFKEIGKYPSSLINPSNRYNTKVRTECLKYYKDCATGTAGTIVNNGDYLTKTSTNGLWRIPSDGIQQTANPVETFRGYLPYKYKVNNTNITLPPNNTTNITLPPNNCTNITLPPNNTTCDVCPICQTCTPVPVPEFKSTVMLNGQEYEVWYIKK